MNNIPMTKEFRELLIFDDAFYHDRMRKVAEKMQKELDEAIDIMLRDAPELIEGKYAFRSLFSNPKDQPIDYQI